MNPTRYVNPVVEPVTLAETKAHLRVDHADDDAYIGSLITVARTNAEDRLERTLINTTWRLVLDQFPQAIPLPMPPIISVSSIIYTDSSDTEVVLNPADYRLDNASEPGWVIPARGRSFPKTDTANALIVTYVAGYGSSGEQVPAPIRHWILLAIGDLYDQMRNQSAEKPTLPHSFADALLSPYRFFGV